MPKVQEIDQFIPFPQEDQYYDLSFAYVVPSSYVVAPRKGWKLTQVQEEATDEEVLRYIERSGYLDFLSNPEEDIYGLDDGKAV